jgi:hypothetical protein
VPLDFVHRLRERTLPSRRKPEGPFLGVSGGSIGFLLDKVTSARDAAERDAALASFSTDDVSQLVLLARANEEPAERRRAAADAARRVVGDGLAGPVDQETDSESFVGSHVATGGAFPTTPHSRESVLSDSERVNELVDMFARAAEASDANEPITPDLRGRRRSAV